MSNYDVVVIGAGNGGLTAAATLVQAGKRVLLLERHNVPGGCATSFRRGRFEFEVALHQLSGMGVPERPGALRKLLGGLGVEEQIDWVHMDSLYRMVIPGQLDLTLKADRAEATAALQERFPAEKEAIVKFYDLVYQYIFESISVARNKEEGKKPDKYPLYFRYALKNSQEVLDEFFQDPLLKAVLSLYWAFMGLPLSRLPFSLLAGNIFVYLEFKPFHMKGGSQALSNALVEQILAGGSEIRFNCGARRILLDDEGVCGVETEHGELIDTRWVVSNASNLETYVGLIGAEQAPSHELEKLGGSKIGVSAICIYIGLDCPPEEVGFSESMNMLMNSADIEANFSNTYRLETDNDPMIVSCYTLDDPSFSPPGCTQVAIVALKYAEPWMAVSPAEYNTVKYRCADTLLNRVEEQFPGFREHIEEIEVATPLTFMRYLGHPGGAFYGFDQEIKDSSMFMPPVSPVQGLYFAGAWVGTCGFEPTLTSGNAAARAILKRYK